VDARAGNSRIAARAYSIGAVNPPWVKPSTATVPRPGFSRSAIASSAVGGLSPSKLSTRWNPVPSNPGWRARIRRHMSSDPNPLNTPHSTRSPGTSIVWAK
jgi:hypothetical protein